MWSMIDVSVEAVINKCDVSNVMWTRAIGDSVDMVAKA